MLANFLLIVGSFAIYNSIQCYIPAMRMTPRIYANSPEQVTDLMSRMMGTWTFTSGVIRIYAAYAIHNPAVYQLTMWTFAIAFLSFVSEVFVYKTAPISSKGVYPALLVSSIGMIWMYTSYDNYILAN